MKERIDQKQDANLFNQSISDFGSGDGEIDSVESIKELVEASCSVSFAQCALEFTGLNHGDIEVYISRVEHVLQSTRSWVFDKDDDDRSVFPDVVYNNGQGGVFLADEYGYKDKGLGGVALE